MATHRADRPTAAQTDEPQLVGDEPDLTPDELDAAADWWDRLEGERWRN
jgi:hypothetical protein